MNFNDLSKYEINPTVAVVALLSILLVSKLYFRLCKNKKVFGNRTLKVKICPFCEAVNGPKYVDCFSCGKSIQRHQKGVVCHQCGYLGEMNLYKKNSEHSVTFLMFLFFSHFHLFCQQFFITHILVVRKFVPIVGE